MKNIVNALLYFAIIYTMSENGIPVISFSVLIVLIAALGLQISEPLFDYLSESDSLKSKTNK